MPLRFLLASHVPLASVFQTIMVHWAPYGVNRTPHAVMFPLAETPAVLYSIESGHGIPANDVLPVLSTLREPAVPDPRLVHPAMGLSIPSGDLAIIRTLHVPEADETDHPNHAIW